MSKLTVYKEASIVTTYMKARFPRVLHSIIDMDYPDVDIQHPLSWTLDFALEVDHALDVIVCTFHNQGFCSIPHTESQEGI
jgi:hypothetical protein